MISNSLKLLKARIDSTLQLMLLWCVPFVIGVRVINFLAASVVLQRTIFRRKIKPLLRFMDLYGATDRRKAISTYLIANALSYRFYIWRKNAIVHAKTSQLERHLRIQGLGTIVNRDDDKAGVILVAAHFGVASLLPNLLERTGVKILVLSRGKGVKSKSNRLQSENRMTISLENALLAQAFLQAKIVLEGGGLVLLLPDGRLGANPKTYPFLDRTMAFQEGFAQLALMTGASVVPVVGKVNEKGFMTFDFQQPLDSGDEVLSNSEWCRRMTQQYAVWLERGWLSNPGNIHQQWLNSFLGEASELRADGNA